MFGGNNYTLKAIIERQMQGGSPKILSVHARNIVAVKSFVHTRLHKFAQLSNYPLFGANLYIYCLVSACFSPFWNTYTLPMNDNVSLP
jgi:hypothetical protein